MGAVGGRHQGLRKSASLLETGPLFHQRFTNARNPSDEHAVLLQAVAAWSFNTATEGADFSATRLENKKSKSLGDFSLGGSASSTMKEELRSELLVRLKQFLFFSGLTMTILRS